MSPAESRARLMALLAKIDQEFAECEGVAAQEVLAYDEFKYLAIQLKFRRDTPEWVDAMMGNPTPSLC